MASIRIGSVEKSQAMVVAVQQHFRQALDSERSLMRMVPHAYRTGTYGQPAGLDSGAAKRDRVGGTELFGEGCRRPDLGFRTKPCCSRAVCCRREKLSTLHVRSPECNVLDVPESSLDHSLNAKSMLPTNPHRRT